MQVWKDTLIRARAEEGFLIDLYLLFDCESRILDEQDPADIGARACEIRRQNSLLQPKIAMPQSIVYGYTCNRVRILIRIRVRLHQA